MALAPAFFDQDSPHGRMKRIMYKKYLHAFIPVTQSYYNTVIIDGFAGAGRYGEDWPEEIDAYGSPLIALMVSLNHFFHKRHGKTLEWGDIMAGIKMEAKQTNTAVEKHRVQLVFVELDKDNFRALEANIFYVLDKFFYYLTGVTQEIPRFVNEEGTIRFDIKESGYRITCTLINKSFQEFDPPNINADTRCLTFADPFGYSHTPMAHVLKFCHPRSELLINLMSGYVNRFVSVNPQGVAGLYGFGQDFDHTAAEFGMEPPDTENKVETADMLAKLLRGDKEAGGNIQSCAKRYEEFLKSKTRASYSLRFEMRGAGNQIIYHLIFLTHHLKGLTEMKESMNRCDQDEGCMRMLSDYKVLRKGAAVTLGNQQDDSKVADAIFHRFHPSIVSLKDIEEYVWLETPYVYRKTPLELMVNDGRITEVVDWDGSQPVRRGTFPGYSSRWRIKFTPDDCYLCRLNNLSLD